NRSGANRAAVDQPITQVWSGHDRVEPARLWNWNVEDFVLHLAGDAGVAFNNRPQSLLLNERERSGVQIRLIPEAVSIACALELVLKDGEHSLTYQSAVEMIFGEATDP